MRLFQRTKARPSIDEAPPPVPAPESSGQLTMTVDVDPAPPADAALGITGLVGLDTDIVSEGILNAIARGVLRGPRPVRLYVPMKRQAGDQSEPEFGVIVAGTDLQHRVLMTGRHGFTWGPGKDKDRLADFEFVEYADASAIFADGWVVDRAEEALPEPLGSWAADSTIEFDADGKVTSVDLPAGEWTLDQGGQNRYYTQRGTSLLHATELLKAVGVVRELTYYTVDTPDGALSRDILGFYTEGPINTSGLALETPASVPETVEALSLTAYGEEPMKSQMSVAQLKQQGHYSNFILLMECGQCGYKSPVETQAGPMERQCYCCGATNRTSRGNITVALGATMVGI